MSDQQAQQVDTPLYINTMLNIKESMLNKVIQLSNKESEKYIKQYIAGNAAKSLTNASSDLKIFFPGFTTPDHQSSTRDLHVLADTQSLEV